MPPPAGPNHPNTLARADRAADYFELRDAGYSRQSAARTMGVSERTAYRYDKKGRPQ